MPQKKTNQNGSRTPREPDFLVFGKLRRAHGVRGEIPMEVYTHFPDLLTPGRVIYIGENHQPFRIESTRWKNTLILLKFEEISDRTEVSELTNQLVYVRTEEMPDLEAGEFYFHELIGLKVVDRDNHYLGEIVQILETGANDVYLIEDEQGQELLLPAIEDVILEIDLDRQIMVVAVQDWYGEGD
jgi:16S rRNA processing protein RimM